MVYLGNIVYTFPGSILIGFFVSALLFVILRRKIKSDLKLRSYAIGFGIFAISNISLLILTMGYISGYFYFIIFVPFMFFSFMLNKKLIKETRLKKK